MTVCCSSKAAFVYGDDEATRPWRAWSDALADGCMPDDLPAYAEACIDLTRSQYRYASRYTCPLVCGCDSWAHPTPPRTSSHIGEGLRFQAAISQLNLTSTLNSPLDGLRCLSSWSMTRILSYFHDWRGKAIRVWPSNSYSKGYPRAMCERHRVTRHLSA
jgi:hypothetical protein